MAELPRHKLSDTELQEALNGLPGWKAEKDKLHREYEFDNFVQAWGFMGSVALVAESMSHHPEWHNVYNKVIFDLWTHTHSGITNLDVDLSRKIEELAQRAEPH
jgi:4a-hydroxytetrahydrobiopterin dehydratase